MDFSGSSNTRELNYILSSSVMLRRLKADVLSQLPPKRRQLIEVEVDTKYLKQVKKFMDVVSGDIELMGEEQKERFFGGLAGKAMCEGTSTD